MARALFLGAALALALLPANVVPAALPLLQEAWQLDNAMAGWLVASYQLGYVVSVLVILPLTDRIASEKVIALCVLTTSSASILFALFAFDVWSTSLLCFLAGLGLAGIYLPGVRLVAGSSPSARRGMAVALYVAAFYGGTALSFWFTGLLLPYGGWRGAALLAGVLALVAIPLVFIQRPQAQASQTTDSQAASPLASADNSRAKAKASGKLDVRVLRNAAVLRTVLGYTGHAWELYVSRGWLAAFLASVLARQGMGSLEASSQGSQAAAIMAFFGVFGVFMGGWLSDTWGRASSALLIAAISAVFSFSFGFFAAAPWWLLMSVGCAYGFIVSADSPIYSTAITEVAPRDQLGSAQALQASIGFAATILAPVASGWLLDIGLGWEAIFIAAGAVGLLLTLPLLKLARHERQQLPS